MSRASTIITCPHCAWCAKHTADTVGEVVAFLTGLLTEHLKERHS